MASLYIPKTEIPVSVGTPPPVLATIPKDPRLLKLINAVHHLPALWRGDLDETNDTEEKRADLWKQVAHQVGAKGLWSLTE
jgi:hypothetical protein